MCQSPSPLKGHEVDGDVVSTLWDLSSEGRKQTGATHSYQVKLNQDECYLGEKVLSEITLKRGFR